ncbi:hypothetical protein B0H16DRAFT_1736340 [Mycena metata]|uniref:Uncharacterized protein n=1 Tax=Mycena metata TaxID=1033252 RepID=A0AAD7HQA4_9AGAR|nr:hypothetical protein B0H16DRAFT_1736340 [Mycena metata]
MGRPLFTSLLKEERAYLTDGRGRPPYPLTQPLRKLARAIAQEEYAQRRNIQHARRAGLVDVLSALDTMYDTMDDTLSPTSTIPITPPPSSGDSLAGSLGDVPSSGFPARVVVRTDYMDRVLVEVVAADCVRLSNGRSFLRYAVTNLGTLASFKCYDSVRLLGMAHHIVRLWKNHGSTFARPGCMVIEGYLESMDNAYPVIVLLVPNDVVHPTFTVDVPNEIFLGVVPGAEVVELDYLDGASFGVGISASHYRSVVVT